MLNLKTLFFQKYFFKQPRKDNSKKATIFNKDYRCFLFLRKNWCGKCG